MKSKAPRFFVALLVLAAVTFASLQVFAQDDDELICDRFVDSSTAERITYYMGEGVGFMSARAFNNAIHSYSCIIEQLDSSYIPAFNMRAVAYTMQQNYELAIEDYDAVLALDSSSRAALNNRGIAWAALREYENAIADFDAVIAVDENYVQGYMNRGVIYAILGDFDSAIADLELAIEISGIDDVVTDLRDPERDPNAERPEYNRQHAQMYAILGIIYSGYALDNYNDYLLLRGGNADGRIQNAAGSLESRFNFDLRLDDGTWLLSASFTVVGEEIDPS